MYLERPQGHYQAAVFVRSISNMYLFIFTFLATQVMFSVKLLYLSVYLSVNNITQKLCMDYDDILWRGQGL